MDVRVKITMPPGWRLSQRAVGTMVPTLDRYLGRAAQEVARAEMADAPKAFSNLVNSIRAKQTGLMRYTVAPGVAYALPVEKGTKAGYFPNIGNLMDYIKLRGGTAMYWAKKGSKRRASQETELRRRAGGLGRYIQAHGTKANPFVARTREKMLPRVMELANQGVEEGLKRFFG